MLDARRESSIEFTLRPFYSPARDMSNLGLYGDAELPIFIRVYQRSKFFGNP